MGNIYFILYVVCFSVSLVLGFRNLIKGDGERASTCFAAALLFLMAILPMFISGDLGAFRSGVGS